MDQQSQLPPEKLLGTPCTPERQVSKNEWQNLVVSEFVAHHNFQELERFVDGSLAEGFVLVSHDSERPNLPLDAKAYHRTKLYRHLHNYLSSLYSFNEQVRLLINLKRGDPQEPHSPLGRGAFVPEDSTIYTQKLAFLRGLRVDVQHGDFRSVRLRRVPNPDPSLVNDDSDVYQIVFDKESFRNGFAESPDKYLQYVSDSKLEYVTAYIEQFHKNEFGDFADQTCQWFEAACDVDL